jgi:hypothetical protein
MIRAGVYDCKDHFINFFFFLSAISGIPCLLAFAEVY